MTARDAIAGMSLEASIRLRRSVRGVLPNELPEPALPKVFDLARRPPQLRFSLPSSLRKLP